MADYRDYDMDYDDEFYTPEEYDEYEEYEDENAIYDRMWEERYFDEQERLKITGDPYYDDPNYREDGYDYYM